MPLAPRQPGVPLAVTEAAAPARVRPLLGTSARPDMLGLMRTT